MRVPAITFVTDSLGSEDKHQSDGPDDNVKDPEDESCIRLAVSSILVGMRTHLALGNTTKDDGQWAQDDAKEEDPDNATNHTSGRHARVFLGRGCLSRRAGSVGDIHADVVGRRWVDTGTGFLGRIQNRRSLHSFGRLFVPSHVERCHDFFWCFFFLLILKRQ